MAALAVPAAAGAQGPRELSPAEQEEARGLFEAGTAAFAAGRYESALDHFERAYELTGLPELLYNIAQSADRLRRDERALEAFRAYLEATPAAEDRAAVEARIAALERTLAERRADAEARALAEEEARRARGDATAPGGRPLARAPGLAQPAGWLVAGAGALSAIAGVALLALADQRAGEVRAAEEGTLWVDVASAYADAESFSIAGGVLLGVGAAALAAGLVWGVLELSATGRAEVAVGPGRLELRGRF
ncbi:MAG: tetratricopeptide repeat protein [Sandaracinaceae bacterium]|nr:tetratricopeptide repeat protein [Sandaracinaceae bacterium]